VRGTTACVKRSARKRTTRHHDGYGAECNAEFLENVIGIPQLVLECERPTTLRQLQDAERVMYDNFNGMISLAESNCEMSFDEDEVPVISPFRQPDSFGPVTVQASQGFTPDDWNDAERIDTILRDVSLPDGCVYDNGNSPGSMRMKLACYPNL
jgi:hypothetical protein